MQKMINFDDVTKENMKEHDPSWPQILGYPHRTLIIGGSGSGKTNSLFNLISQQPDIDKIYLLIFIQKESFRKNIKTNHRN